MNAITRFENMNALLRHAALVLLLAGLAAMPQQVKANEAGTAAKENAEPRPTAHLQTKTQDGGWAAFNEQYLHGKLRLGTRMDWRYLRNSDSGSQGSDMDVAFGKTFLGTIYALDEEQNYLPFKFFVSYDFTKYFGIELAYDSFKAKTVAASNEPTGRVQKTDGSLTLSGPVLSLIGRLPNSTAFTPYIGVGVAFYRSSFDADAAWARTDDYLPGVVKTRDMVVDNITTLVLSAGVTWNFMENWFLDCSVQAANADVDAVFEPSYNGQKSHSEDIKGHFPMDYVAIRIGIGYAF